MRSAPLLWTLLLAGCVAAPTALPSPGAEAASGAPSSAWTLLPPMAAERTENSAVAAAGKLWVIGGIFPDSPATTRVDVYDPATGAWSDGPALPLPLHHAGVTTLGDRIVVTGGYVGSPAFAPTAQTWILDAAAESPAWEESVRLPEPRGAHVAVSDGETIYVFGGAIAPMAPLIAPGQDLVALARTAWKLPPGASEWTLLQLFPDPRDHLAGVFVDGKAYAIAGRDLALARNTGRVDVYDPETDDWSTVRNLPTPRGGLGAAVVDGRIHVVAGESPDGAFVTHEVFDPVTKLWSTAPDLPEPRHGVGVASIEGALYVAGGGAVPGFAYSASVFRYG